MLIAVQMDPIDTLLKERDTSLALMEEAARRGAELWWYAPQDLWWEDGMLRALAHRVTLDLQAEPFFRTFESRPVAIEDFDVVLIRQDPPFDMHYVSNTYLLDLAPSSVLVLNAPSGVRAIPEKISTLRFPHLIASTFVGRNLQAIVAFAGKFPAVVLKPSFYAGGEGVLKGSAQDPGFNAIVQRLLDDVRGEPIVVQEFIPRVSEGDKRVFVLDGEAIGAVRRMPKAGEFRANLHVGGTAVATEVDARDREIAQAVAGLLAEHRILFAGLDVIDGRLTEINVTSPTLVRELMRFSGIDAPKLFWDAVERWRDQRT
jgi:glutathione synthase